MNYLAQAVGRWNHRSSVILLSALLVSFRIGEPAQGALLPPIRRLPNVTAGVLQPVGSEPAGSQATALADFAIPGTITVTIEPPEAVADGARWSVDGGVERASGFQEQGIKAGHHTIQFANLAAWGEAKPIDVLVIGGKPAQVTARFSPLPRFDFQEIPEQQAKHGESLEFFVTASGAALQMSAQPQPAGSLVFDPVTGHVTYTPAPADRLPFKLTFVAGNGQSGTATVTPSLNLPDEQIVLNYERPVPNDDSRDYVTITEVKGTNEVFNSFERETLAVDVSGKTLVFASDHPAKLLQQFDTHENIKEFRLFADRVIIRSPLKLPQTHVTIRARELRFEADGLIDTTPRARTNQQPGVVFEDRRTVGLDGFTGHNGGDIDVLVERFHADASSGQRFIMRGGMGGPAGEGRDGLSELLVPFPSDKYNDLMGRCGNLICGTINGKIIIYSEDRESGKIVDTCGKKVAAKGENAVPAGHPGLGGQGGVLRSTVNLTGYADLAGGPSGTKGANHVGSALTRTYGYQFTSTTFKNTQEITSSSFQAAQKIRGTDAPAPAALAPTGPNGRVEVITDPSVWMHSFVLRPIIQFAKDAYLNGHENEARALIAEYRDLVRALKTDGPLVAELSGAELAEDANLNQALVDMESLVHRVDSNLDFFGNPAGFVPMLSFEANLAAFENEVNQSIPILFLAYSLEQAAANVQNSLDASVVAHDKLEAELGDMLATFNQAQLSIPRLKSESETIALRIGALNGRLIQLQNELQARAEQNVEDKHKLPLWKKALGTLSVISHLVPVGQPVVGQIGTGLGLITQFDPEKPLESAEKIVPKAFDIFSQTNISLCFASSLTNGTNTATSSNTGTNKPLSEKDAKIKRMKECGAFLGNELKQLNEIFKDSQAPKDEIAKELERLKATDPAFKQVTEELEKLNADKEQFAQELAAAMQAVTTLTGAMEENVLSTADLEDRIASAIEALDHNALLHIKEMEQRAKERLLKFQYFVAKAFQYRTLQPFNGNLQLNRLFDRFKVLLEAGNNAVLSQDDINSLKALYTAEIRDIVSQALTILNANAPERSLPISFRLNAEELSQLNQQGQLVINLQKRGLFPSGRQNIRIADLRTRNLSVHLASGTIGAHALLFVDFEHLGVSRLTSGGKTFLFRHYQTEEVNPITWGTVFDGVAGGFSNSDLSPASQSLIRALLNQPSNSDLLLFSRPAAAADILVSKELLTDNGANLVIDELQVEVVFESAQASSSTPVLDVLVSDDLEPVITLNRADLNGRQDGQGDFSRVYPVNTPVILVAPATFGGLPFDAWLVNGQARTAGNTTLSLTLTSNMRAEARYAATAASSSSASSTTVALQGLTPTPRFAQKIAPVTANRQTVNAPAPALTAPKVDRGTVTFTFPTEAGVHYIIEMTPDLGDSEWVVLERLVGTGDLTEFSDPDGAPLALYRVRIESNNVTTSAR